MFPASTATISARLAILFSLLAGLAAPCVAEALDQPAFYDFTQPEIPAEWKAVEPSGAKVTPKDHLLLLECNAGQYAGVELPLKQDFVTVTARIHDAATVYLIWNDNTFVGVGKISPTPFARFDSVDATDGHVQEVDHTGCQGYAAHLMRIQLGEDCIRFQYANGDGAPQWRTLRTIERTEAYRSAPRLVAVGKNFGMSADSKLLVKTDSVGRGNRGLLANVEIAETPRDLRKMNADERRRLTSPAVDPVEALLTESQRDPTFEEVARYYPEMKNKRELVGVPGQRNDVGTDWLGRIDASPWEGPVAWFELGDAAEPFATDSRQVSHRLLDGYVPIVTLKANHDGVNYEMTVFGWSQGLSSDFDLYAYVRLSAWAGGETTQLPTTIALNGKAKKPVTFHPQPNNAGVATLCLRFKHPDPTTAEEISEEDFEHHRQETETAWRNVLAACSPFDLPDPRVAEAYRAWLAYSMLNADRVNGRLEVHDGAGFYDIQFGYSVALHTMALDLYRLPSYVADVLTTQVHLQKPDGHYIQECGLPDQGGFVLALANHYLVSRNEQWMKNNAAPLKKACDRIIARRAEGPNDGDCKGLIKFRPYNDYNDPVFNYQGNILCCQGLEAAAQALAGIGQSEAAEHYGSEAAKYRRDILASMDAAVFTHDGVKMLPIEPDTHRLLKLTKYKGGEYYGLVASTLFENQFFPKDDSCGALYRDMLENHGGLTAGVCEFQEGIDHAYTCGYLLDRLRAGEVRKVLLGFWSSMAYGMTRDTYSPVEVTLYKTGDNHLTLPHTYSCTQQLRLLRYMLLREDGNNLEIAEGLPRAWLEPGKHVGVTEAPTMFGPVSYRIAAADSRKISIHVDPPTRTTPDSVRIHLRHPQQLPIAEASAEQGKEVQVENNVIVLPRPSGPIDLVVTFAEH
jgi:hypothetical protein